MANSKLTTVTHFFLWRSRDWRLWCESEMRSLCDMAHDAQRGAGEIGRESCPGTLYLLLVITQKLNVALSHTTRKVVIKTPLLFFLRSFHVGHEKQTFSDIWTCNAVLKCQLGNTDDWKHRYGKPLLKWALLSLTIFPANISTESPVPFHMAHGEAILFETAWFLEKEIAMFDVNSKPGLWSIDTMDHWGARI